MKIYNKLVRDNIPNIIKASGKSCAYRKASEEERLSYIARKLLEETHELVNSHTKESILEELADLTEVIKLLMKELNISHEELTEAQIEKIKSKGGFNDFVILEKADE